MSLLKIEKVNYKTVNKIKVEESIFNQLEKYKIFLGIEDLQNADSKIINDALGYIFSKDKDFKKYLDANDKGKGQDPCLNEHKISDVNTNNETNDKLEE